MGTPSPSVLGTLVRRLSGRPLFFDEAAEPRADEILACSSRPR